ncbi:hypothetical protein C4566_00950 [Candidatus Parcubacteria bacterium]|nr:MAG: hypothetical protein C4566_00950 [Candidatus Parcubacteria bacterium]
MIWQNITLLIAGGINLIMSIIVFSRGIKNKINLYFGLLTLSNFLWAVTLLLSIILSDNAVAEIFYRTAYLAAIGIAVSLFYFTVYFPYKIKNFKVYNNIFILFFVIIITILIYSKLHIINFQRGIDLSFWSIDYYKPFYLIYSLFFFLLVIFGVYFLVSRMHDLEIHLKSKIKILSITIIIGLVFGVYFDLLLCYFGNFKYIGFGPIFTAFMNAYVFYLLTSNKER